MTKDMYDLICSVPNTADSIGYENIDSISVSPQVYKVELVA